MYFFFPLPQKKNTKLMSWEIGFLTRRQGRKSRKGTICNAHCTIATIKTLFNKPEWGIQTVRMVVFKSFRSLHDCPKTQCHWKLYVQLVIWQHTPTVLLIIHLEMSVSWAGIMPNLAIFYCPVTSCFHELCWYRIWSCFTQSFNQSLPASSTCLVE